MSFEVDSKVYLFQIVQFDLSAIIQEYIKFLSLIQRLNLLKWGKNFVNWTAV